MGNNTGYAECTHCGSEYRLFTIFNRDMQALCKIWKRRHERSCSKRTPAERRAWARKYEGKDSSESSMVVDLEHPGFQDLPLFDIQVSSDGGTVWVTAADGSCVGRFSKAFGLDVHKSVADQVAGGSQCLHCTHEPAGPAVWNEFRVQVKAHHQIDVPADLVSWS